MENNKQSTSTIHDILNDVDSSIVAEQATRGKKRKIVTVMVIASVIMIAVLVGIAVHRYIQNRQFKEGLLETAISITSGYGIDDLKIVSFSNRYPKTVVFQSDIFKGLSDNDKMEIFRKFNELTGTYSWHLDCEDEGRVTIVSDNTRYTARINEYGRSYYRYLYADGAEILKDTYTAPSNSTGSSSEGGSSGGRTGACSGGSVGCRPGYHPCHEMSNGFCNQCCKG